MYCGLQCTLLAAHTWMLSREVFWASQLSPDVPHLDIVGKETITFHLQTLQYLKENEAPT